MTKVSASSGSRVLLRIFRQGYEFFEVSDDNPRTRAGLNFVSFQDTPERLTRLLTQENWLGEKKFGSVNQSPEISILKNWTAGIYIYSARK